MKYIILAIAIATFCPLSAMADGPCCRGGSDSTPNWYAGINGEAVFLKDIDYTDPVFGEQTFSFNTGYGIGGQFGYRVYPNIRVEAEVFWRQNELSKVDGFDISTGNSNTYFATRSLDVMANLLYDYHNSTPIVPYIGGGVGGIDVRGSESEWLPGYQFLVGLGYEFPRNIAPIAINVGYRYVGSGTTDISDKTIPGDKIKFDTRSQNLDLGARLYF